MPLREGADRGAERARVARQLQLQHLQAARHADGLLSRRRQRDVSGETAPYIWGDRMIALHHCPVCACFTHWESTGESYGRIGINARLLDGFAVTKDGPTFDGSAIEVRFLDNAG